MKMEPELYWPEHRVYFVATLALFPEKLLGHEVNPLFYTPYFIGTDMNFINLELNEYRKLGLIEYESTGALCKITSVNSKKANSDLIEYLRQWQQDKLFSLPANKPPDFIRQKSLLIDAAALAYPSNKNEPRITLKNVYGDPSELEYEPKFWELVLSWQLLDKQVKITYMAYGRRIDGLYDDDAQPLIDFTITDNKLATEIKRLGTKRPNIVTPIPPSDIVPLPANGDVTKREGRVIKDGRQIIISISGDQNYLVAQLEKGGSYDRFMNYVLDEENAGFSISIEDVKALRGTLQSAKDLTELIRRSGFNKQMKLAFFPKSKGGKIQFTPVAMLNDKQVEAINKQANNVKTKKRE
jgi:hypothetical protein